MPSTVKLRPLPEHYHKYKFAHARIAHDKFKDLPEADWSMACAKTGGFNPYTGQMTPLKFASSGMDVHTVLDHITAAVEAGIVHRKNWPKQLFASKKSWKAFYEAIEEYCDLWRIHDRWMTAIETLVGGGDEGELLTGQSIAKRFEEEVEWRFAEISPPKKSATTPGEKLRLSK